MAEGLKGRIRRLEGRHSPDRRLTTGDVIAAYENGDTATLRLLDSPRNAKLKALIKKAEGGFPRGSKFASDTENARLFRELEEAANENGNG